MYGRIFNLIVTTDERNLQWSAGINAVVFSSMTFWFIGFAKFPSNNPCNVVTVVRTVVLFKLDQYRGERLICGSISLFGVCHDGFFRFQKP